MKKRLLKIWLPLLALCFSTASLKAQYCTPTVAIQDETITNVVLGTINNPSGYGGGYSNYSALSTTVAAGNTVNYNVTVLPNYTLDQVFIWVDLNNNLVFDASELLAISTVGGGTYTGTFTIPAGTTAGAKRCRIRLDYNVGGVDDPCAGSTYGETEDYTINVTTTACTGTPAPGNTLSTTAGACAGVPFTLSVQNGTTGSGVTYQWQSSSAAAGPYTNIAGATSATYIVASQTVATYYHLVVTCGGNNGTSTNLLVAQNPPTGCYCTPGTTNCNAGDEISNVTMAGINNTTACSANGYGNYLALGPGQLLKGAANPFSVTVTNGGTEYAGVWVDYNQNGQFEASEFQALGSGPGGTFTTPINVPAAALTGTTRMRVRDEYATALTGTDQCTVYTYGETEDYTVNISVCTPVTVSTSPASASVVCGSNATFTVATAGSLPTYQWEYRTTSSGPWLLVPNAAPYSGINTATLTVTGATAALSGYQYRAVVAGACSGPDVSAAATLTVTNVVATVNPTSATVCAGGIQQLSLTNTLGNTILLNEPFNAGVPATWSQQNLSSPLGTDPWFTGNGAATFPAHSGTANQYVAADFASTITTGPGTISNWLFTPVLNIKNGDIVTFWTRTLDLVTSGGVEYPDRLEVRLSSNGASTNAGATATSVGDFTTLLVSVNPTLVTGVYPMTWTQFTGTVTGVAAPTTGRIAFRYFVTNGGGGANSDYIGLDDVVYTSTGAGATGVWTGPAGTIFTNAAATTPYNGTTPLNSVYVAPTAVGANTYSVNFTSGACTSTTATSVVTVNTPPAGTLAVANITTCANSSVTFSFTGLTAGTGLTYQWQVSTNNGVSYTNIAGATSATYTISAPAVAQNGNKFRVLVSATGCAAPLTSGAGTLTVNPIPVVTITAAPVVNVYPGITSTLTAAVSSATAPLSYQWYLNGNAVPGATANTYIAGVDQEGSYSVSVTDANGCTAAAGTSTPGSIAIGDSSGVTILFIYPSPNSGQFQVRYFNDINNGGTAPAFVNVYDSKGARVFTRQYTLGAGYQAMKVDMGTHAKGLYRVELVDLNGNRIKTGSVMVF